MDPRAYLTELGYTAEDISAMLADEKQAKLITHAAKSYSEGRTLKTQAEAEKAETATFWEQKTRELQGSVNRLTAAEKRASDVTGRAAKVATRQIELANMGYEVPEDVLSDARALLGMEPGKNIPDTPKYMTQAEVDQRLRATAPDLVSLTALSNEYRSLYGEDYISIEDDFRAAQHAGKPLRDYARSKYNFDGKKQELATKADQERINGIVAEQMKVKEAELAAKYGGNSNLSTPMPSKFDKLVKQPGFKGDSWKSQQGRDANRADRLKKFENATLQ